MGGLCDNDMKKINVHIQFVDRVYGPYVIRVSDPVMRHINNLTHKNLPCVYVGN